MQKSPFSSISKRMSAFKWPTPLDRMPPAERNLSLALGASLIFHAVLLSVHFGLPDALNRASEKALDVILVNSKGARTPSQAQAKAQANLDGGGNTDEDRRAATPLPPSAQTVEGNDLVSMQKRVADLEAQQKKLLTDAKSQTAVRTENKLRDPLPPDPKQVSGFDMANSAKAFAQQLGAIEQRTDEYNKKPRKKTIGLRAEEYRFAQYIEDWRQKVERWGNMNYPESAKGKAYGSLVLTVLIRSDGTLKSVEINRSSGFKVLDEAAKDIVRRAAPFAVFPESVRRDTDEIEIVRGWTFTNADRLRSD